MTDHVTLAVRVLCNQCGGRHLVALTIPDQDLDGYNVKCPHCPLAGPIGQRFQVTDFAALAAHPGDVDAMDTLEDHERVDWLGEAQRMDYLHVHLKGKPAVDWAEKRGVNPPTVRGAVSRAKKAMREHVHG